MPSPRTQSAKRSLVPTICLAIGMLVGGLVAAAAGAMIGSETVVVSLYAIGTIGGAIAGALVGYRLRS